MPVAHVGLADLRKGPVSLRARLSETIGRGARIVVVDSETSIDLRCLAEALRLAPDAILPVGSAGLAEWLIGPLPRPARAPKPLALGRGPILVVAGTMNRVGLGQLARLLDRGARQARLDLDRALDDPDRAGADVATEIARLRSETSAVVLALADPRGGPMDLLATARARGLVPVEATERLMRALAFATTSVMASIAPAALVLTGGDTARAVCAALRIQALEISREAAPGVPICRLQGGPWDGLTVVTKAGGFGDVETLANVVDGLERMRQ